MPSIMTVYLEIAYAPRHSDMVYDVRLDGLWVASATTIHAADLVADEVRYRMFLSTDTPPGDDEPGDDCPEHGPYDDDECPKCDDD